MLNRILITASLFFVSLPGYCQLYFPNESFYNAEIHRLRMQDSIRENFYQSHLSIRPLMDVHVRTPDTVFADYSKQYYWITQKIFKENFIVLKGKEYWCSIDPIIDLELGTDLVGDSLTRLFWNTRGIRVQAKIGKHVAFSTSVYETQCKVPGYISDVISGHGEFFPNSAGTSYTQNNGIVPGYARTKTFKISGYDFGMAEGQVSVLVNKHLNFQAGNGSQFIGSGYRSLLLSDYTTNYPFAKIQTHTLRGRLQYSVTYALLQNLYRLKDYATVESIYERKLATFHYLDFAATRNWQIGLFHGAVWNRTDSSGTKPLDFALINPVIFSNIALRGMESSKYQSVVGINTAVQLGPMEIYGQFAAGGSSAVAAQAGLYWQDLAVDNLDFRIEVNVAERNTYLTENKRMNWSHSNLPLAHPLVAGFKELVTQLSWSKKRFFISETFIYSVRDQNDLYNIGTNILAPNVLANPLGMYQNHVLLSRLEFGYRFNKRNNLQVFAGHCWRNETKALPVWISNYVYFGIRTKLRNKIFDF